MKRRLSVRQAAAAADRWTDSLLTKRIEAADVVDPEALRAGLPETRAFFGATVRYANAAGAKRLVSIVVTGSVDLNRNHISWVSPLGRVDEVGVGDSVVLQAPGGTEYLTVLEVCYQRISVEPFCEPPGSGASAKGLSPTLNWRRRDGTAQVVKERRR